MEEQLGPLLPSPVDKPVENENVLSPSLSEKMCENYHLHRSPTTPTFLLKDIWSYMIAEVSLIARKLLSCGPEKQK